jgi:peptidoglycan/xylan/chitin deacetylase (PgdA/CDA1 family)
LQTLINIISRPLNGKGAILCFHRILPGSEILSSISPNIYGLCYSEYSFDKLISWISGNYKIVSLDNLIRHLDSNSNEFLISITFDDGYRDNLLFALPILEKYKAPATIYVTKNFIEKDMLIWWYELWEILEKSTSLKFIYNRVSYLFDLNSFKDKVSAFYILKKLFLSIKTCQHLDLFKCINNEFKFKSYKNIFLNNDELYYLANHPLITIGAHTSNHENLRNLTLDDLLKEYSSNKRELEALIKRPIKHFAYPYGNSSEANKREYNSLKNAGFDSGVTLRSLFISGENKMALVRIPVTYDLNIEGLNVLFDICKGRNAYYIGLFSFIKNYISKNNKKFEK